MIEQQFGEKELCFRTLDLYTSAVLEASLNPTTSPKPEWRGAMDLMSEVFHLSIGGRRAAPPPTSSHALLQHQLQACCTKGLWLVATSASGLLQQRLEACCSISFRLGQQQLLHLHLPSSAKSSASHKPSCLTPGTACTVKALCSSHVNR